MKNTKENVIKVIQAIEDNYKRLAVSHEKDGNKVESALYYAKANEMYCVEELLVNEEFFNDIYDIYKNDIKKFK